MIAPRQTARFVVSTSNLRPALCPAARKRTLCELQSRARRKAGLKRRPVSPLLLTRAQTDSSDQELWELHEELLQQIAERKKLHQNLMSRLKKEPPALNTDDSPQSAPEQEQQLQQSQNQLHQAEAQEQQVKQRLQERQQQQTSSSQQSAPSSLTFDSGPSSSPRSMRPSQKQQERPPEPAQAQSQQHEQQQQQHSDQKQSEQRHDNPNAMKVVLVGAECAPWSKTGGLGDVMGALPKALSRRGHRVMVVAPRYGEYAEGWETGVRRQMRVFGGDQEIGYFHGYIDGVDHVFVDHPCFHHLGDNIYGGDRLQIAFRCALLCKAALEAVWHVPCGGVHYGDDNLVYIANDWHTALLPVYLQAHYRDYGQMTYARSLLVIHNIAHQGRGPMAELAPFEVPPSYTELFRLDDPIGGEHMNIMKAGIMTAHRVVAVSHGYAWECQTPEGGWGLDHILRDSSWKFRGIVNGMDYNEWSPQQDVHLQSDGYQNYSQANLREGKAKCKEALQRELGLPVGAHIPMLGFIGRLDYQKGVDLIRDNHGWMMGEGAQLILLGSGRADLEQALREMEQHRQDQCRGWVGFSVRMAHRITAGCDILLMPSRFEPCGLNQLYAMAYGTVPVVHAVGGLRDTVKPYNPYDNTGTGWTFEWADSGNFRDAIGNALYTYREFKDSFETIQKRGMEQDLSWDHAAENYEEVLVAAKYQW